MTEESIAPADFAALAARVATIEENDGGGFAPINTWYINNAGETKNTATEVGESPLEEALTDEGVTVEEAATLVKGAASGITWKGVWSNVKAYKKNSLVNYELVESYIALVDVAATAPSTRAPHEIHPENYPVGTTVVGTLTNEEKVTNRLGGITTKGVHEGGKERHLFYAFTMSAKGKVKMTFGGRFKEGENAEKKERKYTIEAAIYPSVEKGEITPPALGGTEYHTFSETIETAELPAGKYLVDVCTFGEGMEEAIFALEFELGLASPFLEPLGNPSPRNDPRWEKVGG